MDPVSIIAIISGSTALIVSILTHIRYSSCWGCKIYTKTTNNSSLNNSTNDSPTTPLLKSSCK